MPPDSPLEFTLNGQRHTVVAEPGESLLDVLRERCGVRSLKNGCSPQGQCGACLALVDGRPRVTCATPARRAHGTVITTVDGLTGAERANYARAFVAAAGLQCGFCIPGLVLRAHHLLGRNPHPTRNEIARAIDAHLCRCTGYVRIIDAIEGMAAWKRGERFPDLNHDGHVGASLSRVGGREMVLGMRPYVDDLVRPGMLHGALVFSEHARARVLAIHLDGARALPGVVTVATADDVPGARWYGLIEEDWPGMVAVGEEVRCVGDVVAVVAAVDARTAREAARRVRVDYEPLPPVLDPFEALEPEAPRVNPRHPNLLSSTRIHRGDVDAALAGSAHVVSGTWRTQRIEHLFLEPESALAEVRDDGVLHLWTQGQGVFDDRRQVAAYLGLPEERVFVELVPNGGAFGGKEDMSVQAHAGLLAWLSRRPVKVTLRRDESVRMHPKRHPMVLDYTVGCDAEGHLTAVRARIVGDSGAYASVGAKVLERAAGHSCGAYFVPAVDVEARAAYTNHPPCGAMRGFGANQAAFAMEGCMDLLAQEVGLDGWEMRWRNILRQGQAVTSGQVLDRPFGLEQTLLAVRPAWEEARGAGRAVGIACGIKNCGIGNGLPEWGRARLEVLPDQAIMLYNGYTEMGQGLFTVLVQFAVEVTGLEASRFIPRVDSTYALDCGQTTGSRATIMGGRAVVAAARRLRADLDQGLALADLAGRVYSADDEVDVTTPPDEESPDRAPCTHISYGFATQLVVLDEAGRVERVVAAHDVGRAVNPDLCRAQVEGSIHMGLGYALSEELQCEQGAPVTSDLRALGVLRARDMPCVEVVLVEEPEALGPYGARGVGEIGLVPTAGAVAGALQAFDGVRRYALPMREAPAARALSVGRRPPAR